MIFLCLLNVMTIVSPLGYIMNYIVLCHWKINKEAHNCSSKSPDYVTPSSTSTEAVQKSLALLSN